MNLASPRMLVWAVPITLVIAALYLLKPKRREVQVPSVMLWRRAAEDLQANTPWRRLRPNALLVLQMAAALLLVVGVGGPYLRAGATPGASIALVIDGSASMKATDVPGTRFGQAKREATKLISNLTPGDSAMIVLCAGGTRLVSPLQSDRRDLLRCLAALQPTDAGANIREGIALAAATLAGRKQPHIVVFSDGGGEPIGEMPAGNAAVEFVRCGRRSDNVAISALDMRLGRSGLDVFASTHSYSPAPRTFVVELYGDGKLLDARYQHLQPGEEKGLVFRGVQGVRGTVAVRLAVRDDLAADNEAWLPVSAPSRPRVLLVTPGNLFLERALAVIPGVQVANARAAPRLAGPYDIHVYDRIPPARPAPHVPTLLIGCQSDVSPAQLGVEVARPRIAIWRRDSPLGRYVQFGSVSIERGRVLRCGPWGVSLADAQAGPLLAFGERDGVRSVQIGFDLLRSDFPLRAGFPIFVAECVSWLAPQPTGGAGLTARPGQPVMLPTPPDARRVTVSGPFGVATRSQGREATIDLDGGQAVFGGTQTAGLYVARPDSGAPVYLAVNMLDGRESDLRPGALHARSPVRSEGPTADVSGRRELWRLAVLLALVVLALEWYEYHVGRGRG